MLLRILHILSILIGPNIFLSICLSNDITNMLVKCERQTIKPAYYSDVLQTSYNLSLETTTP
jgi:hypothetical protein